jgi:hypothetical protein
MSEQVAAVNDPVQDDTGEHTLWDDITSSPESPAQPEIDRTPEPPAIPMIFKHATAHFLALLAAFSLWAAADTWLIVTGLGLASVLAVVTGAIAGVTVNTVLHEWSHYAGARLAGAACDTPDKLGVFVYDYKFEQNSVEQFYTMSWGGQVGSLIAVLGLLATLPLDNPGRVMLVAAAIGAAVFGAMIEWPVLRRTRESQDPFAELSKIDLDVLKKSALGGLGTALLLWLIVA